MMRIGPLLLIFSFCFFTVATDAQAGCIRASSNPQEEHRINFEKAFYIGIVENIDVELYSDGYPKSLTIRPLQNFKGKIESPTKIVQDRSSVDVFKYTKGDIWRAVIVQDKDGMLFFPSGCGFKVDWEGLLKTADEPSPTLKSTIFECEKAGGFWKEFSYKYKCVYKSSDGGKICQDSNECEGFCTTRLSNEEESRISDARINAFNDLEKGANPFMDPYPLANIRKAGACTPWKNFIEGCNNLVQNGTVANIVCGHKDR